MLKWNIQQFGQDRVLGSQASISIYGPNGPIKIMEVDSCKETRKSSQKTFQPLGQVGKRSQDIYEGYDLDFSGGVTDPSYDDLVYQIDQAALSGQKNIRVRVVQSIEYYDGTTEAWVYPDTVLYGFEKDTSAADSEIKWSFKGSSQTRIPG